MFESIVVDTAEDWLPDAVQHWSSYVPDGLLATVLEHQSCVVGGFEQVERIGGWEKVVAWAQAQQVREIASFTARAVATAELDAARRAVARAGGEPVAPEVAFCDGVEQAAAELALMLRIGPVTAADRVHDALTLTERYPATVDALAAGAITLAKAKIIAEQAEQLSDTDAAAVEEKVLRKAGGQTPGLLRRSVRRAVARADSDAVRRRHVAAVAERGVWMYELPDGMAMVSARLPAAEAVGVHAVLDHCARQTAGDDGDDRSLPARRADALVDLVCGPIGHRSAGTRTSESRGARHGGAEVCRAATRDAAYSGGDAGDSIASDRAALDGDACAGAVCGSATCVGATCSGADAGDVSDVSGDTRRSRRGPLWRRCVQVQVRVTVPFSTLFGLDDHPAELVGYGPITAGQARELAAHGTWRRILTDPATGLGVDYGTTRYRPPAALADALTTAKPVCVHPGCLRPAMAADLDHHTPHHHTGTTTFTDSGPYCRRHHRLKQTPRWRVEHHPDGTVTWTTPTGHTYTHHPTPIAEPSQRAGPVVPAADPDESPPF